MIIGFNPSASNNRIQKQKFGSFPVPQNSREAQNLVDDVAAKIIKPTDDNIKSLKEAYLGIKEHLKPLMEEIAERWNLDPKDFKK
jgi:hypothetical protein